jgi:hypothetical protein
MSSPATRTIVPACGEQGPASGNDKTPVEFITSPVKNSTSPCDATPSEGLAWAGAAGSGEQSAAPAGGGTTPSEDFTSTIKNSTTLRDATPSEGVAWAGAAGSGEQGAAPAGGGTTPSEDLTSTSKKGLCAPTDAVWELLTQHIPPCVVSQSKSCAVIPT